MTGDEAILDDNEPSPLFYRSPHPYHKHGTEPFERFSLDPSRQISHAPSQRTKRNISRRSSAELSLLSSASPSDSGTEADDEKPLLKALKAPPNRPRKRLEGLASIDGAVNFSSAQSGNDTEQTRLFPSHGRLQRQKSGSNRTKDNTLAKGIRQRLELRRRLLETGLFAGIGWLSLLDAGHQARATLLHHTILVLSIVSVRIFWLVLQPNYGQGRKQIASWIPTFADPATLIYPVFLPIIVTLSISGQEGDKLLCYILSFCTLPRHVIPLRNSSIQWGLSLLPLTYHDSSTGSSIGLHREELVLLFPLHSALIQVLYFLTTTSLLEAELQLFAIAMINLLGVPKTPQSSILKALLWIGGLGVLISCRHILKLAVELARVPTWRLRRTRRRRNNRSTIYYALDDTLGGFLSRKLFKERPADSSEDDSDNKDVGFYQARYHHRPTPAPSHASNISVLDDFQFSKHSPTFSEEREHFRKVNKPRRHTFSGVQTMLPDLPAITRTATDALSSARKRSRLILKLTLPQATVLKWGYAGFVYIVVVLIILVPVRLYVQYFALHGYEPIGWALGYLFGDLPSFRLQVLLNSLDSWICLPDRNVPDQPSLGLAETLCQTSIGAANTRLAICAYCMAWIALGLAIVSHLSNIVEVDTRRKVFHGMMVAMFLPTIFIDPAFIALAFTLILAVFLLLDLFRAAQLPPLSQPLTYFLAPYVDGRDHKGPIVISHIFLLIGCAIPLWLSLAAVGRSGMEPFAGWEVPTRELSMVSGVVCVGMGDAAASLIGRRYGRIRWPWSGGKSLEGSAAFAFAVFTGLAASREWLMLGEWVTASAFDAWPLFCLKATVAALGASLTEAVLTGGNDNVVVPVILWLLMRGMKV